MGETRFISRRSIAEMFDTSETTVRKWIENGTIPRPEVFGKPGGPMLERWEESELLRHMGRRLDAGLNGRAASADPDDAVETIANAARKDRSPHARRRHDQGIPLQETG